MNPMKYFEIMERMDQLIRLESTGDAGVFSEKLGISRRQIYYYLEELRNMGLPVCYNRHSKTFYYSMNCRLKVHISVSELSDSEKGNYSGGRFFHKPGIVHVPCTKAT